jgi:hypothetical protein
MDHSELADRISIREIIDRYALAATTRDQTAIASLFTETGEWRVGPPTEMGFDGNTKIAEGIVQSLAAFEFLVQMAHSVCIEFNDGGATAQTVTQEIGRFRNAEGGVRVLGIYQDTLERRKHGWRFARRFFRTISFDLIGPDGAIAKPTTGLPLQ